jgi:hypothetical protein
MIDRFPTIRKLACLVLLVLGGCVADVAPKAAPAGEATSPKLAAMEQTAQLLQSQAPVQQLGVYLVGFHALKDEPSSQMTAHHFCHSVTQEFAQCALFDGNTAEANLTGIEYIISEKLYNELTEAERRYWHPHNYEILSGTLMAPGMPDAAEHELFKTFMNSYGKTWHTWSIGLFGAKQDTTPVGEPHLAWSFNHDGEAKPGLVEARDKAMRVSSADKRDQRRDLIPLAHQQPGVDALTSRFGDTQRVIPGVPPRDSALGGSRQILEAASRGLDEAIRQAEASLGPHQPGSGHTKLHMQRVVNELEGTESPSYKAVPHTPAPADAVLPRLRELRSSLGERALQDVVQSLDQAIHYVEAAGRHARRATTGASIQEVHEEAGLATGLLIAARGVDYASSPITGALAYVGRYVSGRPTGGSDRPAGH